jgi:hypothetical protein
MLTSCPAAAAGFESTFSVQRKRKRLHECKDTRLAALCAHPHVQRGCTFMLIAWIRLLDRRAEYAVSGG